MATLIQPDGTTKTLHPLNAEEGFTLKELYAILDVTTIEAVYLNDGRIMVIDEEGKMNGQECNQTATMTAELPGDYIVGPALLCDNQEFQ